jgi:hypothetical protein
MSDNKKIIELDGEKYETVGKFLDPICCGYSVTDGSKLLIVRPVPKPLREEWKVVNICGRVVNSYDDKRDAELAKNSYNNVLRREDCPVRVVHMREVREAE